VSFAAFKAQATQDMMDDVVGYVAKRSSWLHHQHGSGTTAFISEMIFDALGDTFSGVVAWDPARCPLAPHVKSVIRSRLARARSCRGPRRCKRRAASRW
jgi:hypothetical protein